MRSAQAETENSAAEGPRTLRLNLNNPNHVAGVWRYRQTDERYAHERIGELTFAQAGSGACAMANILDRNPIQVLVWLDENGFVTKAAGILWEGIPAALKHFGASGESLYEKPSAKDSINSIAPKDSESCSFSQLKEHLHRGHPGIILFGPGNWTESAHFVSVVGLSEDQNALLLYDPKGEEFDGWYPWETVVAQGQACFLATIPKEDPYSPRYIFKQVFGTAIAGHEQYWPIIEHDVLASINPDYVGWIHLDKSPLNYPIVKRRLNSRYYLTKNFSLEESCHGCVTLSFFHGGHFSGPNILLKGHDMRDGSMFAAMLRYDEPQWSVEHPIIEFQLPEATYEAQVFSAYPFNIKPLSEEEKASARTQATKLQFDSTKELEAWAQERVTLSSHPFEARPKSGDTFVTFVTCNGEFGFDSFAVHAILKRLP